MFDPCPKVDGRRCTFSTISKYNNKTQENGDEEFTYCGLASGVDNRVMNLPKCWKKMTKYEQSKLKKQHSWGYK
tara:strand:+ start:4199 stop:4420 length:222 start_codon:yes stop_codon:yes gene_type:complete